MCFNSVWNNIIEECSLTSKRNWSAVCHCLVVFLICIHSLLVICVPCQALYQASSKAGSLPGMFVRMVNLLQASVAAHWRALAWAFHAQCSENMSRHLSVVQRPPSPFQKVQGDYISHVITVYNMFVISSITGTMPHLIAGMRGVLNCHRTILILKPCMYPGVWFTSSSKKMRYVVC